MMSSFLLMTTLLMGFILLFMNHPLAMGLVLLVQTCLIALLSGTLSSSFWFSYILFLVFLGGMLVLFIYMTSLASNEMFSISSPILATAPGLIFLFLVYSCGNILFDYLNPTYTTALNLTPETPNLSSLFMKLYNIFSAHLTILLACYLFLTLIVVVNMTNITQGPLRSHNP
uniref:NADH-ubiquinone oxidoreductase chain 6 n=1 Tax=Serratella zapekinae TaxID=2748051 RepID=A0A7D6FGJ0_9INSE|nr:NADH dehydrogenase subunit 6 [Serratella zapekinae]QLP89005.1 NADH dehydrogenase subunit 6 [Serratella zapekinae]